MIPILYAIHPLGPEITRHALRRRLRHSGVLVVELPAGHYILGAQRPRVEAIVAAINADLSQGSIAGRSPVAAHLEVLFRPIPAPADASDDEVR